MWRPPAIVYIAGEEQDEKGVRKLESGKEVLKYT